MNGKIQRLAAILRSGTTLIRDVGVIVTIPGILYIANMVSELHDIQLQGMQAQIAALKTQNDTLKESQYDRAATIIKSQKELSEIELDTIENSISLIGNEKVNLRNYNGQLLCMKIDLSKLRDEKSSVIEC